ncbi:putative SP-containing protein [Vairimorpha necatrix]|uniref:SP-containing protein n=1 Tax=Vairimorpha necatrix TaxID=6039 RepID=A0AAX4JGV1_9MICR
MRNYLLLILLQLKAISSSDESEHECEEEIVFTESDVSSLDELFLTLVGLDREIDNIIEELNKLLSINLKIRKKLTLNMGYNASYMAKYSTKNKTII